MTFGEMQSQLRVKLREASATFWTDQDIKDALNEALQEFADATEYYEREATISLLTNRTYYDLATLLPDTFLSPRRGQNTQTSRWVRPSSVRDMDLYTYIQWELTIGTAEKYFLRGNWWLGVWPRASNDTSTKVRFYYTALPPGMSASADTPGFPREFHPGIVDMALSDLLGQERETKKALAYWTSAQEYVERLRDYVEGRQALAKANVL